MKPVIFLVLLLAGSSSAFILSHCVSHFNKCDPTEAILSIYELEGFLPNGKELKTVCPLVLSLIECGLDAVKDCTGHTMEDLALSENRTVSQYATIALTGIGLIADFCDEQTALHRDYVSSVECVNKVIDSGFDHPCSNESDTMVGAYFDTLKFLDEDSDTLRQKEICLNVAHFLACGTVSLERICGAAARRVVVTVVQRLGEVDKTSIEYSCQFANFGELKNNFLDFLTLDAGERDVFQSIFDAMKKRK